MQIVNAHFAGISQWKKRMCGSVADVLDKARCLEALAFPVMRCWHVWEGSEDRAKPDRDFMADCPEYDLTKPNPELEARTGWIAAPMAVPPIAHWVTPDSWERWGFEFNCMYDPDVYCDDVLIEPYVFLSAAFEVADAKGSDTLPWMFLRIPSPQKWIISNVMARCHLTGLEQYNRPVRDVAKSLRVACQLLDTENRRDNLYVQGETGINRSRLCPQERDKLLQALFQAADAVDLDVTGDQDACCFLDKLEKSRSLLAPLADYAKQFTICFIGHSHIDLAWKWRWPETIACMKGTIEDQLRLMEREPAYTYVESSPVVWKALRENHPEFWDRCRKAAERGQFEPQGATWCESDGMCLSGESWARQLLLGQKETYASCGKGATCGINIDAFGFTWALPKIYREGGIHRFVTQKLRYNEYTIFPHIHFWWEGDDGSHILGLHVYPSHSNHIDCDELASIVRVFHLTDGIYHVPVMWGYGNHGGGPQPRMMDRIDELKTLTVYPNLEYMGFEKYFSTLETEEAEAVKAFPVIRDELFLETHHKTYTVQGKVKAANRECERQLLAAEALTALATEQGRAYPRDLFHEAWQEELFNQFHDILTGTSFPSVYQDVFEGYDLAFSRIQTARERAVRSLLGEGSVSYVFNPLAWRRNAIVTLPSEHAQPSGMLIDSRGNRIPYQRTYDRDAIIFMARDLPGLGFETFHYIDEPIAGNTPLSSGQNWVENRYLRVVFDPDYGVIRSLLREGREISGGPIGELNLLEDTEFRDYETWNMGFTGKEFKPECVSFEKIEDGPVRVIFRARYEFGLWEKKKPYFGVTLWHTPASDYPTSFFTQDFIVYAESDRIECRLHADWWEDKMVLKVSAQTNLENTRACYHIPFGVIERPTRRETPWEKARFEVPANIFADLQGTEAGLAVLNRSRHGYDALEGRLRLTLLTAPWGENKVMVSDPLADRGKHEIEYAFYPHAGDYRDAHLHAVAFEYEYPVVALVGGVNPNVDIGQSYLEVDPDLVVITAIKPAEDGSGIIVRGYEPNGRGGKFSLGGTLAKGKKICRTDIHEQNIPDGTGHIRPHQLMNLRIYVD